MDMRIVSAPVSREDLRKIAENQFIDLVKAVVDVSRKVMAIGGELHADEETLLLDEGSRQEDLWGINLHPVLEGDEFIAFDSMINLRPSQGNRSRGVEDPEIRKKIVAIVGDLVHP